MKSKFISVFLCIALVTPCLINTTVSANTNDSLIEAAESDNDQDFLKVVGNAVVAVSHITSNHFLKSVVSPNWIEVEEYLDGQLISSASIPNDTIDVSSRIEEVNASIDSNTMLRATGYGTVTYNLEPGKPIHRLQISADVTRTKTGTFTYNKSGQTLAQYAAFLMGCFWAVLQ